MSSDQVVGLRDGRLLSYAEYGDPGGFPIISAHGSLACRLDVSAAAPVATEAGIRVIAPDRPGIGRSDPQPGRNLLDWARDVTELLDLLGIDRFAAMGWSLGGQYAAALAYTMPARVERLAIVAGAIPLTEPGAFEALPPIDRTLVKLSGNTPWLARQCFRFMGFAATCAPVLTGRLAAHGLGSADAAVLRAEGYATIAGMMREALRRPRGMVEEYKAMVRPWGFAPEDLRVPVDVWGGIDDELLDPEWPAELARRIPNAILHMMPGGHFLGRLYYRDIFASLRQ